MKLLSVNLFCLLVSVISYANSYQLHVPPQLKNKPALMVMIHGCKEDAPTFRELTQMDAIADQNGFLVLYPDQKKNANILNCWNWFLPAHQSRGQGEPAQIMSYIDEVIAKYDVDPARVFVAGLSSGAAMTVNLISCYPERFAGGAIHAGLAYGYSSDSMSALNQMRSGPVTGAHRNQSCQPSDFRGKVLLVHGTVDETVNIVNTESLLADFTGHPKAVPAASEITVPLNGKLGWERVEYVSASASRVQAVFVKNMKHAWSGAKAGIPYGDPNGPDASLMTWEILSEK